jgi:hypothetical protein
MKEQIDMMRRIIEEIDNNPLHSMKYYTGCTPNTTERPPSNCRELLLVEALHRATHSVYTNDNCDDVDKYMKPVIVRLNDAYQYSQHLCWPSHTHHFHPDFMAYVNCPITCLAEICEYLQRVQKQLYTT